MRLTTSALSAAVLGTALAGTPLLAQQNPPDGGQGTTTASIPGMTASRGARYLLRNGWDYLKYQEYERALNFFVEAERRKSELNDSERQALVQGIDNARRGLRESSDASTGSRAYAGRGPLRRPGAFALAKGPAASSAPSSAAAPEPIQLASATRTASASAHNTPSTPAVGLPPLPVESVARTPTVDPAMTRVQASSAPASELSPLDLDAVPLPSLSSAPVESVQPVAPAAEPAPVPAPAGGEVAAPSGQPSAEAPAPVSEPPAPVEAPAPVSVPPVPVAAPASAPAMPEALPEPPRIAARPEAVEPPPSIPTPVVSDEPLPPAAENMPRPAEPASSARVGRDFGGVPERTPVGESSLSPELQREVDRLAQRQEDELRNRAVPERSLPGDMPGDVAGGFATSPGQPSPRLEISRAPSPTEARPIRAIPVPDEFVPLPKREWEPQRKYWSAGAVCHMPLYFQDAALERYGQSVEQAIGPAGRYFSYPVDDPKQSVQRNQILQPFASIGMFAAQIALLPYNLIMDPPWEAEYDLGYYRPADRIPTDTYYLPLTGVGPPLHGKRY